MKNITMTIVLFLIAYGVQAQIGIGIPNSGPSAVFGLANKTQGFLPPRLTTAERDAIALPVQGLIIFNSTKDCLEWFSGSRWNTRYEDNNLGVVTSYVCNTASTGNMIVNKPVSGVTQTITATVTKRGNYNIIATANGVAFTGLGTYTDLGAQNIVLTATGTPITAGTHAFVIAGTPSTFNRVTLAGPSSASDYVCTTDTAGIMTAGVPVSGVTQTITATVTRIGTYTIRAVANGVTFAATGTFTALGAQQVVLTATGTPTAIATHAFVIAGMPTCTFNRATVAGPSLSSNYICGSGAGTIRELIPVSGVTQTIIATVTRVGTYNIKTVANGMTFAATGTFTALGARQVVLTATGTPIAAGTHSFVIAGTPTCIFTRTTTATTVAGPDGRIWMAYNEGATAPATSMTDTAQYGDLYQWGRGRDGHQLRTSGTTATLSPSNTPGHGNFITTNNGVTNWRSVKNDNLWQGVNGINNPCSIPGFRIPTITEWKALSITSAVNAYATSLKLPAAGFRFYNGTFSSVNSIYWSSTVTGTNTLVLNTSNISSTNEERANGFSVRCIKN